MRFGIVGGGFGYDCHLQALKNIKGVEIVGITDSGSGNLLSKLFNPKIYFDSIESLIREKPNIIAIATPPKNHLSLISKVTENNINIVCEKPFCITSNQALNAYLLVENLKLTNLINFQ